VKAPGGRPVADPPGAEAKPQEVPVLDDIVLATGEQRDLNITWTIQSLYVSASMVQVGHGPRIPGRDAARGTRV